MFGLAGYAIFSVAIKYKGPFFVQITIIYEHLLCKYFVRRSVGQATNSRYVKLQKKMNSRLLFKIELWFFFVKIRLINAHLFYE